MTKSESNHLLAFISFVGKSKTMKKALADKIWATFASSYNSPSYKDNKYDTKLETAYNKYNKAAPTK